MQKALHGELSNREARTADRAKPSWFATCANMYVTGDTTTIPGVNNYRGTMRIVSRNALK
jgi:hypothetical protein